MQTKLTVIALTGVFITAMLGQEFRATITGRVMDTSGAAVPGANVQVRNVDTNEVAAVKTESTGDYSAPFLRPGNYSLTVEAAGFKKYVQTGITLQVAQKAGLNVTLEVGARTESIEVTAEAALLETETANHGGVVDSQGVTELPMNFRNPYLLALMMPGIESRGSTAYIRPFDGSNNVTWTFNGGVQGFNELLLDGAPNNSLAGGGWGIGYVPIVDAVQEMKVMTSTYDAQYGRTSGGISNISIKSGTNAPHGSLFEFMRRAPMDANTFQNNAIGAAKPQHFLDQYGFEFDGPVYIPRVFNGKNRLFFMASFERYREGTPNPLFVSYAEPEFLQGDFSKLTNGAGQKINIYNPFTGRADPTAPSGWVRDPFPNNQIPQSMLSPQAIKILSYGLKPNCSTPGAGYSVNDVCLNNSDLDHYHNMIFKVDENLGSKYRMFWRYGGYNRIEHRPVNGIDGIGEDGQLPYQRIANSAVVDFVGTLSPTFIANVRGSFTRFIEWGYGAHNQGFDLTSLGFPASLINQIGQLTSYAWFGGYAFDSYNTLGRGNTENLDNDYALNGNVTKVWNGHTVHAGIDIRFLNYLLRNTGNLLYFNAHPDMTQKVYNQSDSTSGNSMASFLLGLPTSNSAVNIPLFPWFQQWYMAPFVQDDWKVSRRLTLNLGLRWDANIPGHEKHDRLDGPFSTTIPSPLASQINASKFPGYSNLTGGLTFAGVNGSSRSQWSTDRKTFQPRIGAAFKLTDRFVLRGGFAVYYVNPNNNWQQNTGFTSTTPLTYSLDNGETPVSANLLANPYPTGILAPQGASLGPLTFVGQTFNAFNPDFVLPRMHQFSLGVQVRVTGNSTLDVSYDGSRGYHLQMPSSTPSSGTAYPSIPYNIPSLSSRKQCNILEGGSPNYCNQLVPNPFQGLGAFQGTSFYTASTITRYQLMRPFPQFNGDVVQYGNSNGRSWYNGFQVHYTYKLKGGLNLIADYTLSKWIQRMAYKDPFTGVFQQNLVPGDQTHNLKFAGVYQLPFGKGRKFLVGHGGIVDRLVGGWETTANFLIRSGEPLSLPSNVLMLQNPASHNINWNQYQPRAWSPCVLQMDNNGNVAPLAYSIADGCGTDYSKYAWEILPSYAPAVNPATSGQMRMSNEHTLDFSLNKTIQFTERMRFQLRGEAFNVLNHYIFGITNINTTPTNAAFGTIFPAQISTTTGGFPRQLQLGFKFLW